MIPATRSTATRSPSSGPCSRPGIAQMYTTGEIAANIALETPGLDTLDILVLWKGYPTVASTVTILVNAARPRPTTSSRTSTSSGPRRQDLRRRRPRSPRDRLALPWGGTSHPVWFKHDPRVANVKVLGGLFDRALMEGVAQIVADVARADRGPLRRGEAKVLDEEAGGGPGRDAAAREPAHQHLAGVRPRQRSARPRARRAAGQLQLQADRAAAGLRRVPPHRRRRAHVGFASGCQAFGHRELLGVLQAFGLVGRRRSPATSTKPTQGEEANVMPTRRQKESARDGRRPRASGWRSRPSSPNTAPRSCSPTSITPTCAASRRRARR